jgi:predicted permease
MGRSKRASLRPLKGGPNMNRRERMMKDLDQDIRNHIESETQDNIGGGMSPEDARRAAMLKFGNVRRVREDTRNVWSFIWLEQLVQDVRFALRTLRKNPGFALTAILILALGIAANIIVFGVLQALVLRMPDVPHADRVMTLARTNQIYPVFAYPEVRDLRDGNSVFSAVAAFTIADFGLETEGATRPVWGVEVSGEYFEVVDIRPFLGRLLERADDDHPGASDAAVLTYATWKNNFGADPNIVGTKIRLDKHPYTIVGVTPEGFNGTEKFLQAEVFVPMANEASLEGTNWLDSRTDQHPWAIVRMKDGVTLPQVQADLNAIAARVTREYPKEEAGLGFKLTKPGLAGDFIGGPVRGFLAGVMVLAGIVLLAACANLGSLFAARTADRTKEIALRMAIGAGRWRILRSVIIEAVAISLLGGALACGLAWMALTALADWHPPTQFPMRFFVLPQPSLIVVAFLISSLAGIVFGLMPLRQIFRTDPNDAIKGGGQSSAGRRWALRDVLLAAQIALCCVTVTAAFVSLRGLHRAMTMELGFNPKNAVRTQFDLSQAGYSGDAADHFQRQLLERVSNFPGVEAAGYADITQLSLYQTTSPVFTQDAGDFRASSSAFDTFHYKVSPGYLAASGTPLLAGRDVSFSDTPTAPLVAVVNQEFARRLFHSENVVGRYFKNQAGKSVQIVGLMGDGKHFTLSEDPEAAAFFPISQEGSQQTVLVVRTKRDAGDMVTGIRETIRDMDRAVPIQESGTWTSQLGLSFFPSQVATTALGLFGAFGLLLSITGTFGLASYTVSKRLRELGIRVALGARTREIVSTALGRMFVLLAAGSVVGIVLGAATSRLLSAVVYQATAQDPLVLICVVLTMALTGSLAVAGPVRRALQVDPAKLLREQ